MARLAFAVRLHVLAKVVVFALLVATRCTIASGGGLSARPQALDFGRRALGEKVALTTRIVNEGGKSVQIKKLRTSCGCANAALSSWTIESGGEAELRVVVDGLGREGEVKVFVIAATDDPEVPSLKVDIGGSFWAGSHQLVAFPENMHLGTLPCDAESTRIIRIARSGVVPTGPTKVSTSADWIDVQVQRDRTSETRLYLQVRARPPRGIKKIEEEVLVTGSGERDFVRIPVSGLVAPAIAVSPRSVLVNPGKRVYTLRVRMQDGAVPVLNGYRFDSDGLDLLACQVHAYQKDLMIVTIDRRRTTAGFTSGRLLLEYDGEEKPVEVMFIAPPLPLTSPP